MILSSSVRFPGGNASLLKLLYIYTVCALD